MRKLRIPFRLLLLLQQELMHDPAAVLTTLRYCCALIAKHLGATPSRPRRL